MIYTKGIFSDLLRKGGRDNHNINLILHLKYLQHNMSYTITINVCFKNHN